MKKKSWHTWLRTAAVAVGVLVGGLLASPASTQAAARNVGTVNYVQGYGIVLYQKPGSGALSKYLKTNSRWQVFSGGQAGSDYYFGLGGAQYMSGRYFDLQNETSSQSLNAVGRVKYVPGYSIAIWNRATNGRQPVPGRKLLHNSAWRVFGRKVVNGQSWYELGTNQWIQGTYFYLTKETSRGAKAYTTKPEDLANNPESSNPGQPETNPGHSDYETVFVAATGNKYHFNRNCRGLSNANQSTLRKMTLKEAKAKGYTLCNYEH
ncbi:hypothetical protein [Schleiferilactobacillus harbinensis]|jgi:hypothetical protein|uniref:hypothetical protein n=1 Tax=Schleiferilactobacillus harbinensis TaxID=304207 RepID=UPI0007B87AC0|nr:hypothetical protein [Schleiferilactobacillus harbinensis]